MTKLPRKTSNTCIAAVVNKKGKIFIAGDRRASWGVGQAQTMPRSKINKRDGLILAGTGDSYLCTLFVDIMSIPEIQTDTDTYMHYPFFQAATRLLVAKGFCDNHKVLKIPVDVSAEIIIALQGRLYQVTIANCDEFSPEPNGLICIDELALPYATGCGGHLAWGSLLTTDKLGLSIKDRLYIALKVAADVSPGCNDVIDIEKED